MDLSGKRQRALAGFDGLYRAVPAFLFLEHVTLAPHASSSACGVLATSDFGFSS
jgi:hypothetical protein